MFKIIWDKANNGVLLTMRSTEETLNVPPCPVFFEELESAINYQVSIFLQAATYSKGNVVTFFGRVYTVFKT
ncbi:hypothetical protein FACS189464_2710 [Bacteroidia bacterium]|nr:hypothetical protein FACS189464_2710 [Bacteroidia bacterium]